MEPKVHWYDPGRLEIKELQCILSLLELTTRMTQNDRKKMRKLDFYKKGRF